MLGTEVFNHLGMLLAVQDTGTLKQKPKTVYFMIGLYKGS